MSSVTRTRWLTQGNVPVHVISMEIVLMEGATAFLDFMVTIAVDVSSLIPHYYILTSEFILLQFFSFPLIIVCS
jgi:hypothetical protein